MRYSIEWQDQYGGFRSRHVVNENQVKDTADSAEETLPAFERISVFRTKRGARDSEETNVAANGAESVTGATPTYYIRIYSVNIIHALRSVVKYYPQQDLDGDIIEIQWPYPVLVHYYEELQAFGELCAEKDPSHICVLEKNVAEPLKLLLEFLDKEVMDQVNAEKERNKRGYYTFDYMWVAYRPGNILMFIRRGGQDWDAGVIHSLVGGIFEQPRRSWATTRWSLGHNGDWLGRVKSTTTVERFDGEFTYADSDIILLDLRTFDLSGSYLGDNDHVNQKIDYGETYWDLTVQQCRHHEGMTLVSPTIEVGGMVMADMKIYYDLHYRLVPELMDDSDIRDYTSDCRCQGCKNLERDDTKTKTTSAFKGYICNYRYNSPDRWDMFYLLCPDRLPVFIFGTRTWEIVHVKNLSPPRFQRKMIDTLVMDKDRRRTLVSLAESYARLNLHGKQLSRELWQADFVEKKGKGLIFLLHGGPGVGKTFTAECIAHSLERPLFVLTVSDIGADPAAVEKRLTENFRTAKSWNAVLLFDEADVFLAQRSISDLHRSSLVASFLRALELYDGILFLTTNRVGTFDDAILSRVHVQLFYPDLDDEQRLTMWTTFIKKLESDRPHIQVKYALKEYLRSSEMRKFKMNGREIRNAFQTAVALAEHRAEEGEDGKILLTEEHLREIVELNRSFKTYFDNLHGSEGARAEERGERLDSFIKAIQEKF